MRVVNLDFVYKSQQTPECIGKKDEIQDVTPLDDSKQPLPPPVGSRASGENTNHVAFDLKPTLVSAKVITRYLLAKEKFRKDLKLITVEDHQWHLRSLDHNFVGVLKVYCVECCKEFGSTTGDHSKNTIQNIYKFF